MLTQAAAMHDAIVLSFAAISYADAHFAIGVIDFNMMLMPPSLRHSFTLSRLFSPPMPFTYATSCHAFDTDYFFTFF